VVFLKPDTAILPKNMPFFIPDFSDDIHHEVEILVRINRVGKHIEARFAHKYYDEIGLGIDFTARELQNKLKEKGLPWEKAKAFDGSAVVGNFVSKNKFESLNSINFELKNNGITVQKGCTSNMLWQVDELIAYVSHYFTLKIGDIIFTGTPEGVAKVNANDVLEGYIEGESMFRINVK
jgi:2-keto-4-pentenoate hydratase/2-oxohepta-3-ene-1,7-dioic acid hydratase in catechol pathway